MLSFALLGAITLSNQGMGLVAASVVAAGALGFALFRKDTEIENRRRAAIEGAGVLKGLGLNEIPAMLTDYAVGDYSGLASRAADASKRLLNPANIQTEFTAIFNNLLEAKLKDPTTRKAFLEEVQKKAAVYTA